MTVTVLVGEGENEDRPRCHGTGTVHPNNVFWSNAVLTVCPDAKEQGKAGTCL